MCKGLGRDNRGLQDGVDLWTFYRSCAATELQGSFTGMQEQCKVMTQVESPLTADKKSLISPVCIMLNWAKLLHKPDTGCYQTCLRWVLDEPCNTLPVLNFRLLCSGFTCCVLLRLFSSLWWVWCCRRQSESPQGMGHFPTLSVPHTSSPRDEDLVCWHGPLAAVLAFWLWTIFCNWAGEGCLCFCLGLGLPEPAAPPPPRLQIVPPAPGTSPSDRPIFHSVLCNHLHSTTFSRHYAVTTHSLAHPNTLLTSPIPEPGSRRYSMSNIM